MFKIVDVLTDGKERVEGNRGQKEYRSLKA